MTFYDKINGFLNKTGKSYSVQSLSRVLHLKEDTASKYLRQMYRAGEVDRTWTKNKNASCWRYSAR
jgi:Fic family protein